MELRFVYDEDEYEEESLAEEAAEAAVFWAMDARNAAGGAVFTLSAIPKTKQKRRQG